MPTLVTSMTSAFWHGFYPIYYVMFFKLFLITESSREVFRRRHLYAFIPEWIRSITNHLFIMLSMDMLGLGFTLLLVNRAITFWNSTYWAFNLVHVAIIMAAKFKILPKPYKKPVETKKEK